MDVDAKKEAGDMAKICTLTTSCLILMDRTRCIALLAVGFYSTKAALSTYYLPISIELCDNASYV
jgi:hypothetical protein